LTCNVHSGKKLVPLTLTDDMIGHKIGEFVPTRAKFEFKKKKKKK
jgi:ribosomal protein S19